MEKNKVKKPKVVFEGTTSHFVFAVPVILFIGLLVYIINKKLDSDFFIYITIIIGITVKFFMMFYKKKIMLTDKKIYIYVLGKKFISWSLDEDFYIVNYKQSLIGKIFNFGTLTIINKNKEMYEYYLLQNPKQAYDSIIESYEILMKKLDPNFIVSYKDTNKSELDTIDKIKADNEK